MLTIGIFGPRDDQEVSALSDRLTSRGARPWIVDLAAFPQRLRIGFHEQGLRVDGRPLLEMDAAYLRKAGFELPPHARYHEPVPVTDPDEWRRRFEPSVAAFRAQRCAQAVRGAVIAQLARHRPVVNPPAPQNLHRLKTWLFWRLERDGLRIPRWCSSTHADASRQVGERAAERWDGAVDKPLAGIYKTHLWTVERWRQHRWGRRPSMVQRYVPGDTIRCYVLDGKLLSAARIVRGDTVDSSLSQTGIEVIELEPAAQALAETTARSLGLEFLGMDLQRHRDSGEYFVIDCNLSPMFVNYARLSRCDVSGRLADHLMRLGDRQGKHLRPAALDMLDDAKELLRTDEDIAKLVGKLRRS